MASLSPIARRRQNAERDFRSALAALAKLCASHERGEGDERMLTHAIERARENVETKSRAVARVRLTFG
jgi:hypothetical protein